MYFPVFSNFSADVLLTLVFAIALIGIVFHYIICVLPVGIFKSNHIEQSNSHQPEPVSVIICARNEDDNLTEFLPKILTQNYPNFEVIVVNDCSYDNTENVIDEFAKIFPNLKKINIKEDGYYKHGKKFAMLVGIKGATYNNLVFIDGDCFPANDMWLQEMSSGFVNKREIVLGYGAYQKEDTFINKLIRFDTFLIATNYLSAALKGQAYMGVGRNLAYTKELFYKQKGFANHYHIDSGDDDLFVNQAANEVNTNVAISHNSITYSVPKKTFTDWKRQKNRHLTTAPFYNAATKTKLGFGYFAQYFFYLSLFSLLFFKTTLLVALIGLVVKVGIQMLIFKKASQKLNEMDLWSMAFAYEFILLLIYPVFTLNKMFSKTNKWKN